MKKIISILLISLIIQNNCVNCVNYLYGVHYPQGIDAVNYIYSD